ncbi:hypothetical protein BJ875DRAFT_482719 [Amylocarpus encephaloides]|uniref:Uncharacterized protein n=1 Tax=Amylocarpus encephaloides TaxID=45428 RepID=A0A9P7YMS8_9HELO|nr:hypothetical protein BJ875DRAFT_482719 [Amylocarpus encephaloides]
MGAAGTVSAAYALPKHVIVHILDQQAGIRTSSVDAAAVFSPELAMCLTKLLAGWLDGWIAGDFRLGFDLRRIGVSVSNQLLRLLRSTATPLPPTPSPITDSSSKYLPAAFLAPSLPHPPADCRRRSHLAPSAHLVVVAIAIAIVFVHLFVIAIVVRHNPSSLSHSSATSVNISSGFPAS